jgi:hypothetical protein
MGGQSTSATKVVGREKTIATVQSSSRERGNVQHAGKRDEEDGKDGESFPYGYHPQDWRYS